MRRSIKGWLVPAAMGLLLSACAPDVETVRAETAPQAQAQMPAMTPKPEPTPKPPPEILVRDVLRTGVVIVISKASQRMHVFVDGQHWQSSDVSTGKRGKETPSGVFAILQKKKFHRSNLYSNAPMPFMQRLTWDGIAIHAGRLPGYPASHGCIRLPRDFASALFSLTGFASTAVIVVDEALDGEGEALQLARATDAAIPIEPTVLAKQPVRVATKEHELKFGQPAVPAPPRRPLEPTIQLVAASSEAEAREHWERVKQARPELAKLKMAIEPALVNAQQYYRLRVSGTDALLQCDALKRDGIACFPVS